jgi:hypothetical protein
MYRRNIPPLAVAAALIASTISSNVVWAQSDVRLGLRQEDVRILGQDSRDELGSSLAVGDVTGDTIGDLVIGVRQGDGRTNARADAGEVVVFAGGPLIPVSARAGTGHTIVYGPTESANLGDSVAVGDLNGDGIGDLIMGAGKADTPESGGAGTVFVMYGRPDLERSIDLGEVTADIRIYGDQSGGTLGRNVAVGDFNADGVDDVAVAAPREGRAFDRIRGGVVYIVFGKRGLERSVEIYPATTVGAAVKVLGPTEDALLGHALAAGDVNGDGVDDVIIGASVPAPFGRVDSGDVYVVFGGQRLVGDLEIDLADPLQVDLKIMGPQPIDHFGQSVGAADVNGDGVLDILIGAPTAPFVPSLLTGRAYAVFGRPFVGRTVLDLASEGADVSLAGPHHQAEFGTSVAGADMNGDGLAEWVIGAPGDDLTGQAYRVAGREIWSDVGVVGAVTQGVRPGDRGGEVTAFGDVSGDGVPDLVMSAPLYDGIADDNRDSGAAYVVFGKVGPQTVLPNCSDLDGDGFATQGRTCGPVDCNDTQPQTFPSAEENCTDGIDNNCDGFVDEDGVDADEDGYPGGLEAVCSVLDCNDANPAVNPGASELCNDNVDNDCNGLVDGFDPVCALAAESCVNCVDDDGDGVGDLYEEACQTQPVEFADVVARKSKFDQRTASKLKLTARLYDAPFLRDPNIATTGVILGLGFSADRQQCLQMTRGKRKKNVLALRGAGAAKTSARFRQRSDGTVTLELETQNPLVLPETAPITLSVGVFAGDTQYRGASGLHTKGTRALVRDK